ncbi:soluble scavenger receptor cysteine-rich domain-containing protein SSC5D-like [Eublepharis macularius]|uniref:Soluble scavenger receptor cysteine-rich domain-containing protein SSC5D n=1 Tax=Eublepharis macularius TaxID=481883 RepID=A0AA97K4I4_EUBMA|nr:soluble scavenger receptor cysteine-rich domain-containing protein SSC5D-like [Eublepharis macularius]
MQRLLFFLAVFLQFCATDSFTVRLLGGPNLCAGRVELFHQGKWGTVCDDDWDIPDAAVVCRELDCGQALSAPHGAWFGEGTGPIWLNEVHCRGTERHLQACHHKGFRKHVCTHEEDASVICSAQRFPPFSSFSSPATVTEGKTEAVTTARPAPSVPAEGTLTLRLIGGRSRCSGRLEVFHQGQWGTVCDDMWGLPDVTVVCRELGCGEALAAPGSALFGEGNDAIWLDDVQCQGQESSLTECLASPWGTHNCRHNEDAGAVCSGEMPLTMVEEHLAALKMTLAPQRSSRRFPRPTQSTRDQVESLSHETSWHIEKSLTERTSEPMLTGQWQVRLAGGSGSCSGRVEVLHKDSWGTVCDDGWDLSDAAVVCRELGCGAPLLSPGNARYGPGYGPIWLDDVNCTGMESTLQHCRSQPWGQHNCNHHEDASVICTGTWKPLSLPEPARDSNTADPIQTTQGSTPADESGLQNTLDVSEDLTQTLPPAWETEAPSLWHPSELFLPPTHETELEEETTNSWNIQEIAPGQQALQDIHDRESTSLPNTRSPPHKDGLEPTYPSVESQPPSAMWDRESEGETQPTSPPGTVTLGHSLKAAVETVPPTQWDDMSRGPPVTQKAEPSNSSADIQPASGIRIVESERETEPTSFSGTELLPVTQTAMDTVTPVHWDEIPEVPLGTQEPLDLSTETQPDSAMWVWESERETESTFLGGMELFPFSESLEATREVEMPTATQSTQPMINIEETSLKGLESKGDADPKKKEDFDKDSQTVTPIAVLKPTIVPNATSSRDVADASGVADLLFRSPALHIFDTDSPSEKGLISSISERGPNTTSTPGQTKTLGTSIPVAEPVAAKQNESSPGCPARQELREDGQGCCCSPPILGDMAHAMDSLRGELGSLSTAIQQQGSQLEAVAHSLAELATSMHRLVEVLPSLIQPVLAQPSSAPCKQDESEVQNQLPLQ